MNAYRSRIIIILYYLVEFNSYGMDTKCFHEGFFSMIEFAEPKLEFLEADE